MWLVLLRLFLYSNGAVALRNSFQECGIKFASSAYQPTIAGGTPTVASDFPWHVALYKQAGPDTVDFICGGSIIDKKIILTAAHCIYNEAIYQTDRGTYFVAAGKYHVSWAHHDVNEKRFKVIDIKIPPSYQGTANRYEDDIALLILNETIPFSSVIMPVCVDWNCDFEPQNSTEFGIVAGWGYNENGTVSDKLMSAQLKYYSFTNCDDKFSEGFIQYITPDKFCAGTDNGTGVEKGDSGGGLVFPRNNTNHKRQYFVYGIVSNKDNNRQGIGAFTNVCRQMKWLFKTTERLIEVLKLKEVCGKTNQFNYTGQDGKTALVTGYPWLVAIYRHDGFQFSFNDTQPPLISGYTSYCCSGSIIHPKAILTVANSFSEGMNDDSVEYYAVTGKYNKDLDVKDPTERRYKVKKIHQHQAYLGHSTNYENNIAIVELAEEIEFNQSVLPVCVDWDGTLNLNTRPSSVGTLVDWDNGCDHSIFSEKAPCMYPLAGNYRFYNSTEYMSQCKVNCQTTYDAAYGEYKNGTKFEDGRGGSIVFPISQNESEAIEYYIYGVLHQASHNHGPLPFTSVAAHLKWIKTTLEQIS